MPLERQLRDKYASRSPERIWGLNSVRLVFRKSEFFQRVFILDKTIWTPSFTFDFKKPKHENHLLFWFFFIVSARWHYLLKTFFFLLSWSGVFIVQYFSNFEFRELNCFAWNKPIFTFSSVIFFCKRGRKMQQNNIVINEFTQLFKFFFLFF